MLTYSWKEIMMKLITKEIEKQIPALYSQDGKEMADVICYAKLFDPYGQSFWFLTEYDPNEKLAFGWACLGGDTDNAEFGYVSIAELEEIRFMGKPRIERDKYFKPCPLGKAVKERLDVVI